MVRLTRRRPLRAAAVHDRRSRDLPLNAEVAPIEVDDPLALEPGERIVALRSIRNDPLARCIRGVRSMRPNIRAAVLSRTTGNVPNVGRRRSIPAGNMSTERSVANRSRRPAPGRASAQSRRTRTRRGRCGARERCPRRGHDHGTDRSAARAVHPALERLFLASVSGMPRPAGPDLRFCEQAEIAEVREASGVLKKLY